MVASIIKFLAIWVILLPLVMGIIRYRYLEKSSRILFWLVVVATPPQLLTALPDFDERDIVYNVYTLLEFMLTGLVFYVVFKRKKSHYWLIASLFIYGFAIGFDWKTITEAKFSGVLVAANNLFFLSWVLLFLFEQFFNEKPELGKHYPLTWFIVGILLYTVATTLYFVVDHNIRAAQGNHALQPLKLIQQFFNIVMYLLFAIGFYVQKKPKPILIA